MTKVLILKIKEALVSVLPVALIVLLLAMTPLLQLSGTEIIVFGVSAVMLILGISLFNMGADIAMTPMGVQVGSGLSKSRRIGVLLGSCFVLGVLITVAEPDLSVLAAQVKDVMNGTVLILSVGIGVGVFLLLSVLKIVFRKPLSAMLLFFYMVLFALAALVVINGNESFLALAFDSGGVTTGPITVPFIMALGVGIAATLGGKNVGENSFGLIAMCSVGPILAVMFLGITAEGQVPYQVPDYSIESHLGAELWKKLWAVTEEVALALGLVVAFFAILQVIYLKLPRQKLGQIAVGSVVMNRVKSSLYPNTIWGVIFDRKYGVQFSPIIDGAIYQTPTASAVAAAKICLEGFDVNSSALFFLYPRHSTSSWIPNNRTYIFSIGKHDFYA